MSSSKKGKMRVLVFCAHADDEVIGMGGTLRSFAAEGAAIRLVMFSEGAEGYATPEEKKTISRTRDKETKAVCRLLGIQEYVNLHGLDWSLPVNNAAYRSVIGQIREFQPDVIFTHAELDYSDHIAVSRVTREGWFHAALACAVEKDPLWPMVPLYEFEVINRMTAPTHIVDITGSFEFKKRAMELYGSQTGIVGSVFQMMEGRALERGYTIGVKYGEAFRRSDYRPRAVKKITSLLERE